MDVRLRSLAANSVGKEIKLPAARFLIGRDEDCHLRPKSDLVSRHHCMVLVEDDGVVVRDLGSRNGTYVNDQRIAGEQLLAPGDRLRVGPLEFEVCIAVMAPAANPVATPTPAAVRGVDKPAAAPAVAAPPPADDLEAFYLQALGELASASTPSSSPSKPAAAPRGPATAPQKVAAQLEPSTALADTSEQVLAEETETITSSASGTQILRPAKGSSKNAPTKSPTASEVGDNDSANDEHADAAGAKVPPPKGIAGKLPFPKTMTKDSRSAAADTLRKFFNRR